jgi:hypothetical protein
MQSSSPLVSLPLVSFACLACLVWEEGTSYCNDHPCDDDRENVNPRQRHRERAATRRITSSSSSTGGTNANAACREDVDDARTTRQRDGEERRGVKDIGATIRGKCQRQEDDRTTRWGRMMQQDEMITYRAAMMRWGRRTRRDDDKTAGNDEEALTSTITRLGRGRRQGSMTRRPT